jgi:hypothetical protein
MLRKGVGPTLRGIKKSRRQEISIVSSNFVSFCKFFDLFAIPFLLAIALWKGCGTIGGSVVKVVFPRRRPDHGISGNINSKCKESGSGVAA